MVELDVHGAPECADRDRGVEPAVLDPKIIQQPQGLPGEPAEFRMVPLVLQLADDNQRKDKLVFLEAE